ncbi:hypothetical protein AWZ03_015028, partial [Drosophila navojoa]
ININEKQLCSDTPEDTRPCAPNGHNIFNTNVVFDRHGTVVSRYRKVHLYGEPRNSTFVPESVSFDTDFNVTFGHFICFDILFYAPAHEMRLTQGIRDFVFPTMWFSQLPFLTAVQVQLGWSYANDVNLLAAGSSHTEYGSTGTGIFNGRKGTITSVMNLDEGERRIYVAQVPKYPSSAVTSQRRVATQRQKQRLGQSLEQRALARSSAGFKMKRDDALELYESVWLQQERNVTKDVCHGSLCCHFELEWSPVQAGESPSGYRVGAFDGWRNEQDVDNNYVRNCGIFVCSGPNIEDCGLLLNATASNRNFSRLLIEASYPKSQEFLLTPNSVRDNLLPLEPSQFEWSVQEEEQSHLLSVRFALAEAESLSNLLTFAIYGNYYDDICTYGIDTPDKDIQCGYKPKGDGAADLRFFGNWFHMLTVVLLIVSLSS